MQDCQELPFSDGFFSVMGKPEQKKKIRLSKIFNPKSQIIVSIRAGNLTSGFLKISLKFIIYGPPLSCSAS